MISDPVGDMLTRIRNGYMASKKKIVLPHAKIKEAVLKVLVKNKIVSDFKKTSDGFKKNLEVTLFQNLLRRYQIKRISKPGCRIYLSAKDYYSVKGKQGFLIISTSKGVMDSYQAEKDKLGGEVLAEIF